MNVFEHFYTYEFTYEVKAIIDILNNLSPEEKVIYNCHPRTIDWKVFIHLNAYGYQKYIFK